MNVGMDLKLDWLGLTYNLDDMSPCEDIFDCFLSDFPEIAEDLEIIEGNDYGLYGFDRMYKLDHDLVVFVDDFKEKNFKGLNIQIPSHSLQWFSDKLDVHNVSELFELLEKRHCKPSRIDICFDDFTKIFRPSEYMSIWLNTANNVDYTDLRMRTKFRRFNLVSGADGSHTFYVGSRGADRFMRIYDKDIESGGVIDAVRYEFEFHARGARAIWKEVIENNKIAFRPLLVSFFQLVIMNRNDLGGLCRWPMWDKFREFLEKASFNEMLQIPKVSICSTFESHHKWFLSLQRVIKREILIFGSETILNWCKHAELSKSDCYLIERLKNEEMEFLI